MASESVAESAVSDPKSVFTPPQAPQPMSAEPKQIATFPPIPKPPQPVTLSRSTGQPKRHPLAVIAVILGYLAALTTGFMYARFWWQAAHKESFLVSARLLDWVEPTPGKWLAITLVCVLTAVAAMMAAAPAIIGFNAWNGYYWTRIGSLVACLVTICGAVLFTNLGWITVGFTLIQTVLIWLPGVSTYFYHWRLFRTGPIVLAQSQDQVFYGPLPRYR